MVAQASFSTMERASSRSRNDARGAGTVQLVTLIQPISAALEPDLIDRLNEWKLRDEQSHGCHVSIARRFEAGSATGEFVFTTEFRGTQWTPGVPLSVAVAEPCGGGAVAARSLWRGLARVGRPTGFGLRREVFRDPGRRPDSSSPEVASLISLRLQPAAVERSNRRASTARSEAELIRVLTDVASGTVRIWAVEGGGPLKGDYHFELTTLDGGASAVRAWSELQARSRALADSLRTAPVAPSSVEIVGTVATLDSVIARRPTPSV